MTDLSFYASWKCHVSLFLNLWKLLAIMNSLRTWLFLRESAQDHRFLHVLLLKHFLLEHPLMVMHSEPRPSLLLRQPFIYHLCWLPVHFPHALALNISYSPNDQFSLSKHADSWRPSVLLIFWNTGSMEWIHSPLKYQQSNVPISLLSSPTPLHKCLSLKKKKKNRFRSAKPIWRESVG